MWMWTAKDSLDHQLVMMIYDMIYCMCLEATISGVHSTTFAGIIEQIMFETA